jgi:hypothetical protein
MYRSVLISSSRLGKLHSQLPRSAPISLTTRTALKGYLAERIMDQRADMMPKKKHRWGIGGKNG